VIDFSPRWRPPAFASAIVVADALIWEGADASVLDAVAHIENFSQYLVRAPNAIELHPILRFRCLR
jgi:hypothetical protein